jgi:ABC-2 type transport system permease protein
MNNLIHTEFKRNSRSLILWTSIVSGLAGLMLFLFPAFKDAFDQVSDLLSVYPPEFLEIFGMGENGLDITTIYGWYGVEGYLFVTLIGGSYAAILGSSILSKEEDDKTIEFLLSKPISRTTILVTKSVVIILNLVIMNIIVGLFLLVAFLIFGTLDVSIWLLYTFAPILLQLFFASLSLLLSIFITKSRSVISMSLGLAIGMYVIDIISTLTDSADFLKYTTPYEFVNAVSIVNNHEIKLIYFMISLFVIIGSFLATWKLYSKKDILI